jgi:type II secretion system protein G
MHGSKGFTLIELLIVVAIIAILAAIAVPNFLEAQIRSKVSRARADMRNLATALEGYCVDNQKYPPYSGPDNPLGDGRWRLAHLSTPVAYITSIPADPFADQLKDPIDWQYHKDGYIYAELEFWSSGQRTYNEAIARGEKWFLAGRGPNQLYDSYYLLNSGVTNGETEYDPTNGTRSFGDIERFGP